MRTIALINQKGGVGKTSTAVNLGASLASKGYSVLLVDLDPQFNLTSWILGDVPGPDVPTIADVMMGETQLMDAIKTNPLPDVPGLDLLPASLKLCELERYLATEYGAESILKAAMEDADLSPDPEDPHFDLYDYIIIDCAPAISLLTLNAMTFVKELIIPLQAEVLALNGLTNMTQILQKVQKRLNPDLTVTGILMVMVKSNTNLSKEVEGTARKHFGELVFNNTIRESVRVAECPSHAQTLLQYCPSSPVTKEYLRVADEVIAQTEEREEEKRFESEPEPTNRIREHVVVEPYEINSASKNKNRIREIV